MIVIITGSIGFYPLIAYNDALGKYKALMSNISLANEVIGDSNALYSEMEAQSYSIDIINDPKTQSRYKEIKSKVLDNILEIRSREQERNLSSNDEVLLVFNELDKVTKAFFEQFDIAMSTDPDVSRNMRGSAWTEIRTIGNYIEDVCKQFISSEISYGKIVEKQIESLTRAILITTLIIILIILFLAMGFAIFTSGRISDPIKKLSDMAVELKALIGAFDLNESNQDL